MCSTHVGCFCVMIFYYSLLSCIFKLILLAINMHRWRVEGWRKKRCLKAMVGKGKPWVRRWLCLVSVLPLTEGATLSKSLLLFILKREGFPQAWTYNTGKTNKKNQSMKNKSMASLVVQWLRICLAMQGTPVQFPVQEDPICRRATKPMHHNYWSPRTNALQQEKPPQRDALGPQEEHPLATT